MTLNEPVILVLSGQGLGSGVEHATIRLSIDNASFDTIDYPRLTLVESWASLNPEAIPQSDHELVLVISRHADQNGNPWLYISEYVKANLKNQTRGNHYSGVGIAIRASIVSAPVFEWVHKVHEAMIKAIVPKGEFTKSVREWSIPGELLADFETLTFESLDAEFEGVRPGKSAARIIYSRDVKTYLSDAQNSDAYRGVSAVILSSLDLGPSRDIYYRNEDGVDAWIKAKLPPPPPLPPVDIPSTKNYIDLDGWPNVIPRAELPADSFGNIVRSDNMPSGLARKPIKGQKPDDEIRRQLRTLEGRVDVLQIEVKKLRDAGRSPGGATGVWQQSIAIWIIIGILIILTVIAGFALSGIISRSEMPVPQARVSQGFDGQVGLEQWNGEQSDPVIEVDNEQSADNIVSQQPIMCPDGSYVQGKCRKVAGGHYVGD